MSPWWLVVIIPAAIWAGATALAYYLSGVFRR